MRTLWRFSWLGIFIVAISLIAPVAKADDVLVYTALEDDQIPRYLE
jgi:hypothetical protein